VLRCAVSCRDNLSLRLFLLSPASGSVWMALFYPLPMPLHLLLLGLSSFVAVCRISSLEQRLQRLEASSEHLTQTYQRLSRFSRCVGMLMCLSVFSSGLKVGWKSGQDQHLSCGYAGVGRDGM
jgi:hypothetical protein